MRAPHPAYPLVLVLPDGVRAEYRDGCYWIDGEPTGIDVEIPPDLVAASWYWHGSVLRQPAIDGNPLCGIGICTSTFGVEGTFAAAREIQHVRAEREAARIAERVARATKRPRAKRDAVAEAVQMELF